VTYAATILVLIGAALSAVAALGVLRFPDVYTRLHAASKAGPLGAGLILLEVGLASGDWATGVRCVLGALFLVLTSPVSAHLLARAALRSGIATSSATSINEYDDNQAGQ
jgi:multicomponent Na+:H+ antiporter subunit G